MQTANIKDIKDRVIDCIMTSSPESILSNDWTKQLGQIEAADRGAIDKQKVADEDICLDPWSWCFLPCFAAIEESFDDGTDKDASVEIEWSDGTKTVSHVAW